MIKHYLKIINAKCKLTMYPNQIYKQKISKLVSTSFFDSAKNVLKDNFTKILTNAKLDQDRDKYNS